MNNQLYLFEKENISIQQKCYCGRCGALCKVDPLAGSKARMLKRGSEVKGLCINCAVHDFLRNTYPANLLLAQSGPKALAFSHIQEQFAGIMKSLLSDAMPDEINWQEIIENWELPFPNKLKSLPMNPVNQAELDRASKEGVPLHGPGYPLSADEQIEEQRQIVREALKKIFPNGKIIIQ